MPLRYGSEYSSSVETSERGGAKADKEKRGEKGKDRVVDVWWRKAQRVLV